MKTMKTSVSILGVVLMIGGICMISSYSLCQSMLSKGLMKIAFQDVTLDSVFHQKFTFDEKREKQFEVIKNEIMEDDQLQQIVHDYSLNILNALANGNGTVPDLEGDTKKVLEKHEAEVQALLPADVPLDQQVALVDYLLKDIDLQPIYDQAIHSGREHLSPLTQNMMQAISWFASHSAKTLGIVSLGVGMVLLVMVGWERMKWMRNTAIALSVSGLAMYGVTLIIQHLNVPSHVMIDKMINVFSEVALPQMHRFSLWLLVIAIVFITVYFLLQKLFFQKRKP